MYETPQPLQPLPPQPLLSPLPAHQHTSWATFALLHIPVFPSPRLSSTESSGIFRAGCPQKPDTLRSRNHGSVSPALHVVSER